MDQVKVGIIGCGNISGIYIENIRKSPELQLVALADLDSRKAMEKAKEEPGVKVLSPEELIMDQEVEVVLNLTVPKAHGEVSKACLQAKKHVYVEKPLSLRKEEGMKLLQLAEKEGLYLGGAPDTFLGAGLQTSRKLIHEGWIGRPVAAVAFMMGHGPESWHPEPDFFYKEGAGPLFDMGPYYLTAFIHLLGPIRSVMASTQISFPERLITSSPHDGNLIRVDTPTHIAANLEFHSGAMATLITSFDVWEHGLPHMEIYGSEGTLRVPDPNTFGGPVFLFSLGNEGFREMPLTGGPVHNARGIGLEKMAKAIRSGTNHPANGKLMLHVLDAMESILQSGREGRRIYLTTTITSPEG
ncbi:Gfo/Idh/MocA family protein [Thermicanus aegyptius]|uniref:Gfo/Idh/MocA family protein n=1 Tax=Thermicanus aegyptius TaxID=94009 RepID=UPI0003F51E56|nr:Gfo/Idh/MocA family oxidoreductase [Thermicanus aegyptius]